MTVMFKRILLYSASTLFPILSVLGFFILMMPLSDPNFFDDSELKEFFLISGALIVVGAIGCYGFIGFYMEHTRFLKIVGGTAGFIMLVIGPSCIMIAIENKPGALFLIASLVYGAVVSIMGFFCLLGPILDVADIIRSKRNK